jgi:hypothetical protein
LIVFLKENYNISVKQRLKKEDIIQVLESEYSKSCNGDRENLEEDVDLFGNEIQLPCIGSDDGIYDLSSMEYLFRKDENDDYININYIYNEKDERVANFPIMNNGKQLTGYYCQALNGQIDHQIT